MSGTAARKISSAPPVLFKRMGGIKSKNHIVEAHHFYTLPPAGHPLLPHTSPALRFSMTKRCHPALIVLPVLLEIFLHALFQQKSFNKKYYEKLQFFKFFKYFLYKCFYYNRYVFMYSFCI